MAKSLLLSIIVPILACLVRRTATLAIQSRQSTINAVDPFDHAWIEQWAGLGDSFGVGLGAGHAIKSSDNVCATTRIYTEAWLIAMNLGRVEPRRIVQRILLPIL
jgi:hypothetical protein